MSKLKVIKNEDKITEKSNLKTIFKNKTKFLELMTSDAMSLRDDPDFIEHPQTGVEYLCRKLIYNAFRDDPYALKLVTEHTLGAINLELIMGLNNEKIRLTVLQFLVKTGIANGKSNDELLELLGSLNMSEIKAI